MVPPARLRAGGIIFVGRGNLPRRYLRKTNVAGRYLKALVKIYSQRYEQQKSITNFVGCNTRQLV